MKLMKPNLIAALLMVLTCHTAQADETVTRRCLGHFQDKHYELVVKQSDLDAAPLWREDEANPPLTMRRAIASAREVANKIPNSEDWKVSAVILERTGSRPGQWVYIVQFTTFFKDTIVLGPGEFDLPVLLNGKTPELIRK